MLDRFDRASDEFESDAQRAVREGRATAIEKESSGATTV
jgi:hypothetical protein